MPRFVRSMPRFVIGDSVALNGHENSRGTVVAVDFPEVTVRWEKKTHSLRLPDLTYMEYQLVLVGRGSTPENAVDLFE